MTAYYNEFDPYAAEWLRNLISAGHIAAGDVDERSIVDVRSDDIKSYTQVHFFAGIGGWSRALRLAMWPDDRPVWTGSCPCQPFSAAGKQRGTDDERHLWPVFRNLIAECRPATVFGEQVASKLGRDWLGGVRADLEALGYAVGAADLCAAGVGAPHIRQRLWWVADAHEGQRGWLANGEGRQCDGTPTGWQQGHGVVEPGGDVGRLGHADDAGPQGRHDGPQEGGRADQRTAGSAGVAGFWSNAISIPCSDGKARRAQPGIFPLAHGVPGRVGKLRAAGNAIVPQVAAEFIRAVSADNVDGAAA